MKPLSLLALLTLWPCVVFSQTGFAPTPKPVAKYCFTPAQFAPLRDSVHIALPEARKEARYWRTTANNFEQAAIEAVRADSLHQAQAAGLRASVGAQRVLLTDARAQAAMYRARAHRKGWLLAAVLAGVAGFVFLHP